MKLEFRVGDKILLEPKFDLYSYNAQPDLLIVDVKGVSSDRKTEIEDCIDSKDYIIAIENGVVGLQLEDVIYSFDMKNYIMDFICKQKEDFFYISFVFLEHDDKVRNGEMTMIRMKSA
ncbi:hypothetical protein [Klebsiella pneumoniae]|uniref:hypothetical protein n=1 Tax=Klebsiella pneumoniae TaxID=573 RepID=UPI0006686435|nr:hypothetical protein [Klebsiella pneumoniae]HDT3171628.1 hypothetical protein [Klebsiella pneumoniae subsp. pneumoniae]EIX9195676.1 hypothetical protein [Klebsiella pneumoniae]MBK2432923.1 hypothetical protein [Klebsiella pneumoniae]MCM5824097.1 hypothetical protein [Klebsiella pneumoniae]RNU98001.1 hypothetical protein B9467_004450 [Klebsiella pneumoniae]